MEILQKANFSIHVDENTIHNEAILLVYVIFIHEDDIMGEILLNKSLSETICGEQIFNEVIQYFKIPLTNLRGNMEEPLNIHAIHFGKTNSVNGRLFEQLSEYKNFKSLLLHTEVRWLLKGLSLERLVNLLEPIINFLKFKSKMTHSNSKKQADKAIKKIEGLSESKKIISQ